MGDRLKKRGKIWYCWVPDGSGGELVLKSTRCTDKDAARVEQARLEREGVDPTYATANQATIDDVIADYRASRVRLKRASGTIEMIDTKGGHLARLLPERISLLQHDGHNLVSKYVDQRLAEGARLTTIGKELSVLRGSLKLAKRNKKFRGDIDEVMPEIENDYTPRTRALSAGELQKLTNALLVSPDDMTHRQREVLDEIIEMKNAGSTPTLRALCKRFGWSSTNAASWHLGELVSKGAIVMTPGSRGDDTQIEVTGTALVHGATTPTPMSINRVAFVLYSVAVGGRLSETMRARRCHIQEHFVEVISTKTKRKGKGDRKVPILAFMRPMLDRVFAFTEGRDELFEPWSNVIRDLEIACARAGIEKVTPNDLRRTLGNWLRGAGIEPQLIGAVLGHMDGRMAERVYGKLTDDALAKVLDQRLTEKGVTLLTEEASLLLNMHDGIVEASKPASNAVRYVFAETVDVGRNESELAKPEAANKRESQGKTADLSAVEGCPETESNCRHGDFQSARSGSFDRGNVANVKPNSANVRSFSTRLPASVRASIVAFWASEFAPTISAVGAS